MKFQLLLLVTDLQICFKNFRIKIIEICASFITDCKLQPSVIQSFLINKFLEHVTQEWAE